MVIENYHLHHAWSRSDIFIFMHVCIPRRAVYLAKFFIAKYTEDTDSIPCVLGKIVSGVNPLGNIRDLTADIYQKDVLDAIINLIGTVIDAADGFKVAGKVGKFLLKNADDVGVYSAIIRFINTKCPDLMKYLGKNDEFVEATKKVSLVKDQKMTKSEYDEISDALSKAGLDDVFNIGNNFIIDEIIESIPSKLKKYGKCDEFAQSLVNSLTKKRNTI